MQTHTCAQNEYKMEISRVLRIHDKSIYLLGNLDKIIHHKPADVGPSRSELNQGLIPG